MLLALAWCECSGAPCKETVLGDLLEERLKQGVHAEYKFYNRDLLVCATILG